MQKITLFFAACLLFATAVARPVTPDVALTVAQNFWQSRTGRCGSLVLCAPKGAPNSMYFFSPVNADGFVIVAADDVAVPILGYSFSQPLGDELSDGARYWLGCLDGQIAYACSHDLPSSYMTLWQPLLIDGSVPDPATSAIAVQPLLSTTWNQSPYYNVLCPSNASGRAVTGCVATAMAQIMKYWNFPTIGQGSFSYNGTPYGNLSANFGATRYDWANMPASLSSSSTNTQLNAVGTLMYHCGVSVAMDYSPSGSGAVAISEDQPIPAADVAFRTYFAYDASLRGAARDTATDAAWMQYLKNDISAGCPVFYSGRDTSGGHAFVCDGYDTNNYFHFNWGWGGYCDGYYPLSALSPAAGGVGGNATYTFNLSQRVIFGLQPDRRLLVSDTLVSLSSAADSHLLYVVSAASPSSWSASTAASWLSLSSTSGPGAGALSTIVLSATPNSSGRPRSAQVTITQDATTLHLVVVQRACDTAEMCSLQVNLVDQYGDSWNGAYLSIVDASSHPYADVSVLGLSSASFSVQVPVCPDTVQLIWHSGVWDDECSISVYTASGALLYSHFHGMTIPEGLLATITQPCSAVFDTINSLPYHWNIENGSLNGWSARSANTSNEDELGLTFDDDGSYVFRFSSYDRADDYNQYLFSPRIELDQPFNLSFDCRSSHNSTEQFRVYYSSSDTALASFSHLLGNFSVNESHRWTAQSLSVPAEARYIMIDYYSNFAYRLFISNLNFTPSLPLDTIELIIPDAQIADYTADEGLFQFYGNVPNVSEASAVAVFSDHLVGNYTTADVYGDYSGIAVDDAGCYPIQSADFSVVAIPNGYQLSGFFKVNDTIIYHLTMTYSSVPDTVEIVVPQANLYDLIASQGLFQFAGNSSDQAYLVAIAVVSDHIAGTFSGNDLSHDNTWVRFNSSSHHYTINNAAFQVSQSASGYLLDGFFYPDGYPELVFHITMNTSAPEPEFFSITVASADSAAGSVTGSGTYAAGDTVIITAIPNPNYEFVQWHDGTTDNPRTIIVTADSSFIAYFRQLESISDIDNSHVFIFPNPSMGIVYIQTDDSGNIVLLDAAGRSVLSSPIVSSLDLSALPRGIYWLQITTSQGSSCHKLVLCN